MFNRTAHSRIQRGLLGRHFLNKSYDVVALSQALVDVTSYVPLEFIHQHNLEKGTTTHLTQAQSLHYVSLLPNRHYSAGSTAANTLCGMALLGSKVAYISRLAQDEFGVILKQSFEKDHIDYCGSFAEDPLGTGRCIVLITPDADRTMLTYLGAAHNFSCTDYDLKTLDKAKIVLVEAYQLETPGMFEATKEAVAYAKKAGAFIVLSAANPHCLKKHRDVILSFMLEYVDFFVGNTDEFKTLAVRENGEHVLQFFSKYVSLAAMTRGKEGADIFWRGERFHVPPPTVSHVIDTCGAGDQFLAGFLYALSRGYNIEEAAHCASNMSGSVLGHTGARPQSPITKEILRCAG